MLPKTESLIRFVKIIRALEVENHFECDEDTMRTIIDFTLVSNLSDKEIQKEILEAHSYEQLKVEIGIDDEEEAA
jgi:hypothetical protein